MHDYPLKQRTIGHLLADKAARVGDRTWLIFGEQRYTYAQAHELSNRYANGFRELGVGKGDHVAVMLPNCSEFIWTIWGLAKLGAVTVPLNTAARGELLRYFITQSDSSCVVVAAEWADRVAEALGSDHRVRACLTLGGAGTRLADCGATCVDLASFAQRAGRRAGPHGRARQRSAIHHVHVRNDRPLEGRDQSAFAGTWRRPFAGAELRLSARRRALHLPAAVPRQCALVFGLCGAVGGLRAGGVAAIFGQQFLGRDQGCRGDAVQFAGGDDQYPVAGAGLAARPRAPRAAGDGDPAVARNPIGSSPTVSEFKVTSLYAMTETFAVTMFTPEDPRGQRRFGRQAARPRGSPDRQ